jgi:hypothetical protein
MPGGHKRDTRKPPPGGFRRLDGYDPLMMPGRTIQYPPTFTVRWLNVPLLPSLTDLQFLQLI